MKTKEVFELRFSSKLIITSLIVSSFFISFFIIIFQTESRTHYLIEFPVAFSENSSVSELHYLKKYDTLEKNAEALVKDYFLGPFEYRLEGYFNPQVQVNSVILRGHDLFVDLSPEKMIDPFLFDEIDFLRSVKALENTIKSNLRTLNEIKITFDGQELSSRYFSL